jgi:hypothetical protein
MKIQIYNFEMHENRSWKSSEMKSTITTHALLPRITPEGVAFFVLALDVPASTTTNGHTLCFACLCTLTWKKRPAPRREAWWSMALND